MGNNVREPGLHHDLVANTLNELDRLRNQQNLSISEWSRRSGLPNSAITRLDKGAPNLTLYAMCKMASGLGLKPEISFVRLAPGDPKYDRQPDKQVRVDRAPGARIKPKTPKTVQYAPPIHKEEPVMSEVEEKIRQEAKPGTFTINREKKSGKAVASFNTDDVNNAMAEFLRNQAMSA